jgi:hypothetical protein
VLTQKLSSNFRMFRQTRMLLLRWIELFGQRKMGNLPIIKSGPWNVPN